MCIILFNTVLMALDGYGISAGASALLGQLNLVCTVLFTVEAAIKILAFGFKEYLQVGWNVFDFTIVTLSLLDELLESVAEALGINPTLLRALRTLRVSRILRTVKSAKGIRQLLAT